MNILCIQYTDMISLLLSTAIALMERFTLIRPRHPSRSTVSSFRILYDVRRPGSSSRWCEGKKEQN